VPGLAKERLGGLASHCFWDAKSAVEAVLKGLPVGARVALVPEGPYVYARVEDEAHELVV
jgi:lactate racemase